MKKAKMKAEEREGGWQDYFYIILLSCLCVFSCLLKWDNGFDTKKMTTRRSDEGETDVDRARVSSFMLSWTFFPLDFQYWLNAWGRQNIYS